MSFITYAFLMAFVHSKIILIEKPVLNTQKHPFPHPFQKQKKIPNPTFLLQNIWFGNTK
jgi:hypothetical protein